MTVASWEVRRLHGRLWGAYDAELTIERNMLDTKPFEGLGCHIQCLQQIFKKYWEKRLTVMKLRIGRVREQPAKLHRSSLRRLQPYVIR